MGTRGPKCKLCYDAAKPGFDADILRGEPVARAAELHGIPRASAFSHAEHVRARVPVKVAPPRLAPEEVAGTPVEEAAKVCAHLKRKLAWAEANGVSMKEQSQIAGQLTNANRFHARLCGALDITEAQILKSTPWQRIEKITVEVLEKHPEALADWKRAVASLMGVG